MFDLVPFNRRNNIEARRGDAFSDMMNSFFNDDFFAPVSQNFFGNSFSVDLKDTGSQYVVDADLPGIDKKDLKLYYENNYLTIAANRNDSHEEKDEDGNYLRRERSYGEFRRTFYVDDIDENSIKASFNNGVLTVTMNKLNAERPDRRIIDIE